ncbi:MAG: glycerophosphodiester phosphodiesterase [Thermoplasmatota archaeon]
MRTLVVASVAFLVAAAPAVTGDLLLDLADDLASDVAGENPWLERRVLHIAHQGGEAEAPSNTMVALHYAMSQGADVLEIDVHATADGELVVIHDTTVDRTTDGTGRVDAMSLAEIQALDAAYWFVPGEGARQGRAEADYTLRGQGIMIPTLREVLEAFPDVLINIEIKATAPETTPYEHTLAALLEEYGRGDDTIVVSFLDPDTEIFRLWNQDVSTATGTGETALFWAASNAAGGAPSHHHALQVPINFNGVPVLNQDFVDDAHASGLAVHVWTIGDAETMHELIDLGVDGIMTDRPSVLQAVLVKRGLA